MRSVLCSISGFGGLTVRVYSRFHVPHPVGCSGEICHVCGVHDGRTMAKQIFMQNVMQMSAAAVSRRTNQTRAPGEGSCAERVAMRFIVLFSERVNHLDEITNKSRLFWFTYDSSSFFNQTSGIFWTFYKLNEGIRDASCGMGIRVFLSESVNHLA